MGKTPQNAIGKSSTEIAGDSRPVRYLKSGVHNILIENVYEKMEKTTFERCFQ